MAYTVYMLLCADGTYYTGITTDVVRRVEEHNGEKLGARYTKSRQPVKLVYQEAQPDRSNALKREIAIKRLAHAEKQLLANNKKSRTRNRVRQ